MQNDKDKARQVLLELLHIQPNNSTALRALDVLR